MDGWTVEDFIIEMVKTLERTNGMLGEMKTANNKPLHIDYGDLADKDKYLRYLNAKSKPRYNYFKDILTHKSSILYFESIPTDRITNPNYTRCSQQLSYVLNKENR